MPRPHVSEFFLNPQLSLCEFGFRPHVSGDSIRRSRNFLNPPLLQRGNFLIRYEAGIGWTLLSSDVTRSSPVLYTF